MLIDALAHPDWRIFEIARYSLARMGSSVKDALLANLTQCGKPRGRIETLWCLHQLADPFSPSGSGDASLLPHIEQAARSDDSDQVRAKAIEVLSRSEAFGAEDTIVGAIEDPSEHVRGQAVKAAGRLCLKKAIPFLIETLGHHDPEVRADVIYALDRIGEPCAAKSVRALLTDEDWYVRWCAAKALENLWEPENAAALESAANDSHRLVALAACEAAERRGRRNAHS